MPATSQPDKAPAVDDTPFNLPPELASHPRYKVLRELGRGGMGVVYEARQTLMNRQVVIKVISKALLDHPDAVERFRREVEAAARLSHPNIVTAYDAEQAGELHMLVMEFVPGQSLAEVLKKKGPLAIPRACHFARQAALGLQHAFEQGMVHRDIKLANLMLTPKGQVKILDFGLAKLASEHGQSKGLTSTGAYIGTPEYSAPEQATSARSADIRADIYSLGCTLYCLLAGRPPFQEETVVLTLFAHMTKEPTPLPELRAEVPAGLWKVVAKMLARDPAQRFQQPGEPARALLPFMKSGPRETTAAVVAPRPGPGVAAKAGPLPASPLRPGGKPPATRQRSPAGDASPFEGLGETLPPPVKKALPASVWPWARRWRLLLGAGALLGVGAVAGLLALVALYHRSGDTGPPARPDPAGRSSHAEVPRPAPLDCTGPSGLSAAKVRQAQEAWAKYLGRDVEETVEIADGVKMTFVLVPPGTFRMGSQEDEKDRSPDETLHLVTLNEPFDLCKTEVTQAQYKALTGKEPSHFKGDDLPVETVSWEEARDYAANLTTKRGDKHLYRLPTEAEWEYACRGGRSSSNPFGIGDGRALSSREANFNGKSPYGGASEGPYLESTCRVGSYPANALGLFDMHGNVWEWCADWYRPYPPGNAANPTGPAEGSLRVYRGGGWGDYAGICRAASRYGIGPGIRISILGFRLARSLPSGGK
jgi:formylglycine-generating enzyme required for sulfatase activity/tRNA A-37 threonylcarbamoyl transferase component Bud32